MVLSNLEIQDKVYVLWIHATCPIYHFLSRNVLSEVCIYLHYNPSLAFFTDSDFQIHHFSPRTVTQVQVSELITAV